MNMVSVGEPEVQEVSVEDADLPDTELPKDNDALFEQVRNDPDVQTADMEVEGDWTFGTIADRISMEERVNNNDVNWEAFKQVNWGRFTQTEGSQVSAQTTPNTLQFNEPAGTPINELSASGTPEPFISLGEPAAAPSSGFATGDPGLGSPGTKNYKMDGRAGNSSAVTRNGDVILTADAGTRAIAFNPPGDADFLQMINQRDWGHQARAVLEALTQMAGLGTDSEVKAPVFSTVDGPVAFATPYQYSFSRVMGVALMQASFDIQSASATTMTFTLRQPDGSELTSADVELSEGAQTVAINFLNAPPRGVVTLDSQDTAYTVAGTDVFPPV